MIGPGTMLPGLSKEFAWGIVSNVPAMKPVLSSCFRNGSQLDVTALGTSVDVLICASEQSSFVGSAAKGPNTLRYRSGLPSGDFGEPSRFTVATWGAFPTIVGSCLALPLT